MIPEMESSPQPEPKGAGEEGPVQLRKSRSELLRAFAEEFAKEDDETIHSWDIHALLHDEYGLPK